MGEKETKMVRKIVTNVKTGMIKFAKNDEGVGVVEVILILVVLIGLVVIFRDQLTTIMNGIFERIVNDSNAL